MTHALMPSVHVRRKPATATLLFGGVVSVVVLKWHYYGSLAWFAIAFFTIVAFKLALALPRMPRWPAPNPRTRVGVVVTVYNEDPELLRRCLDSILDQTFPPTRVVVVDDASTDPVAYELARDLAAGDPRFSVIRQPVNLGKREGLAAAFCRMEREVDVFLCLDSDSFLQPTAIDRGIRPFRSRRILAVTGIVVPLNPERNLLTRFQDVLYTSSFLNERTAQSRFASVLCVSGAIAFYRADVALTSLDDFLDQRFLGRRITGGEDRRMTGYCLREGRVVFAEDAVAQTAVPERFRHFLRQQTRWGRSFFRESFLRLHARGPVRMHPGRVAWWLTLLDVAQWVIYMAFLAFVLFHVVGEPLLLGMYLLFLGMTSTARGVRYFDLRRSGQGRWSRIATFACAPMFGYFHVAVMVPLRLWAFLTPRVTHWGARRTVEVTSAAPASTEPDDENLDEHVRGVPGRVVPRFLDSHADPSTMVQKTIARR